MKKITLTIAALFLTLAANHAQARIDRQDRVLVVVSELQTHGPQNLRPLYRAIEELTQVSTSVILGDDYRQVHMLKGANATVANFKARLQTLSKDPSIRAIDVIFSLHGSTNKVYFREGGVQMSSLLTQMTAVSGSMSAAQIVTMKKKLRMIYNLSCFGQSDNNEFRSMGFDVSVGSVGVNANSEAEYASVLTQWSFNWKFIDTFNVTNNNVALAIADQPVRLAGIPANSKKMFAGATNLTISTDPN
jgi:phage-related protein